MIQREMSDCGVSAQAFQGNRFIRWRGVRIESPVALYRFYGGTGVNTPYASVMFARLDGKDIKPVIWKMVRLMTAGANPMVDAHNT